MREEIKEKIDKIKKGEVPKGYKKNKNEYNPSDWLFTSYNKLFKVASGVGLTQKHMIEENIPVYGGNGISGYHNEFNSDGLNIIIGRVGANCGSVNIFEGKCWITDNALYIKEKYTNYDDRFMYYKLKEQNLNRYADRNAQPLISGNKIYDIKTAIPSKIDEQKSIANILSTWDKAIELKRKLIEQKKEQKRGLLQNLLTGEARLPGFHGEWNEVILSDIFDRVTRKNSEGNNNVLTISAQRGLINQEDFFNKSVASDVLDNYSLLLKGEFAYNKSYSNGYPMGAIKRLNIYESGVVTTLYICFKLKEKSEINSDYLEQYFESGLLNNDLTKIAQEGGRAHGLLNVSPKDFFDLAISLPEEKEQNKIAKILCAANKEIDLLEQKLEAVKLQKKGLMQLLLTGIVRV